MVVSYMILAVIYYLVFTPIILVLLLAGLLVFLTSTGAAPFLYTLF